MSAALKRLKRGKAAGLDETTNTFYRNYADTLGPILATFLHQMVNVQCVPSFVW